MEKTPETPLERAQRLTRERLEELLEIDREIMSEEGPLMDLPDPLEAKIADLRRRVEALEKRFPPPKKPRRKR